MGRLFRPAGQYRTGSDIPSPGIEAPDMPEGLPVSVSVSAAPVHVLASDARVRLDAGRLCVEYKDKESVAIPIEQVSALHVHGWVQVTSATVAALASIGSPVVWRSPNGYPIAVSQPLSPANVEARRAQYMAAADRRQSLEISRRLVSAKIRNMRGLLRRRLGAKAAPTLRKLDFSARTASRAKRLESLLGIEGQAAAIYFSKFPALINYRGPGDDFEGRTRRPPSDIGNAALSYLYMVLMGECTCALSGAGLDVREGFLHQPRAGRPALALDFMEPYRPLIVDACVSALLNRGQLRPGPDDPARLGDGGKRLLLREYEKRLAGEISGVFGEGRSSWRAGLHASARDLAASLVLGKPFYPTERP